CCRASVALARMQPLVVADACGDREAGMHESNLLDLRAKYADVLTLDEAVGHWGRARAPAPAPEPSPEPVPEPVPSDPPVEEEPTDPVEGTDPDPDVPAGPNTPDEQGAAAPSPGTAPPT
ncbi:hypothetical protein HQ309_21030, partial [Rhodococcus sp. BP-283]|nr:hypothetical protein [Rhodococcus sp. BP-283]